ncbi:uncharacterized protein PAC_15007 [Phialocephala subalpina]|uniref:F-box domain-containing protein n=1 Tax=Phialocephala subalpina TaxID=576137 RepID=A0A1L7XJH1_9HELO|nr:uncharacterized protein PAC_15007 [Phialocephala subalpina]
MNVDELRAALAESLRANAALRVKQQRHTEPQDAATIEAQLPVMKTGSLFLDMLPREIWDKIYRLLLVNIDLGSHGQFQKVWAGDWTMPHRFDLSAGLLRTSRQIHEETSATLYGENTFVISFGGRDMVLSPLLRWFSQGWGEDPIPTLSTSIAKVKRCTVVLTAKQGERPSLPDYEFVKFCQALSQSPLTHLEVLVLPKLIWYNQSQCTYDPLPEVLYPLQILRGITSFHLGDVPLIECYTYETAYLDMIYSTESLITPEIQQEFETLVKGTGPARRIFKMFDALLAYAQMFEINPEIRSEMKPQWGVKRNDSNHKRWAWNDGWGSFRNTDNPFLCSPLHPVEDSLQDASMAIEVDDIDLFVQARQNTLEYLEPQYQRIMVAAREVAEFVKEHKICSSFLDAHSRPESVDFAIAIESVMVLERYAKSFRRDVPPATEFNIRKMKHRFLLGYSAFPRETSLRHLGDCLDATEQRYPKNVMKWCDFSNSFRLTLHDMDEQYLQIREARKRVYDYDDAQYPLDIDLEFWRYDELIEWNVNEPVITIESAPPPAPAPGLSPGSSPTWGWGEQDEAVSTPHTKETRNDEDASIDAAINTDGSNHSAAGNDGIDSWASNAPADAVFEEEPPHDGPTTARGKAFNSFPVKHSMS